MRSRPPAIATSASCSAQSHEIKLFAEGVQVFSFRNARWHLLDLKAKYETWAVVGRQQRLAERLFQTAIDLADAREGALFVVLRDPTGVAADAGRTRRSARRSAPCPATSTRHHAAQLLQMLQGRSATDIDPAVLSGLARTDGATVLDPAGRLLAVGAILLHTEPVEPHSSLAVEGARTTAAMAAGRYGAVLKVSEDGVITFYDHQERIWDI